MVVTCEWGCVVPHVRSLEPPLQGAQLLLLLHAHPKCFTA